MTGDTLLTAAQVAQLVGVSRRTVARWVESGRIKAVMRLPGKTGAALFTEAEVDRLLNGEAA